MNKLIALPYLNVVTPCLRIGGSLAMPAAALIEAQPGVGKSAINEAVYNSIDTVFIDIVLSTMEPGDIGGYPWPDGDRVRFLPAAWVVRAYEAARAGKNVVIMVDEFNWSPPALQAAAMRMILTGRVGDIQLDPERVRFILVQNPVEHAEGSYGVLAPVANRVTHYKVGDPGTDNFIQWLSGAGSFEEEIRPLDLDVWQRGWARKNALICSYLRSRPGMLVEDPSRANGRGLVSYATRRSWTSFALIDTTREAFGWEWASEDVCYGSIGKPNGLEYRTWERVMDIGDPEEFLKAPKTVPIDLKRDDRMYAIGIAICTSASTPQKRMDDYADRWNAAWECVDHMKSGGVDKAICSVMAKNLIHKDNRPKGRSLTPLVMKLAGELNTLINLINENV